MKVIEQTYISLLADVSRLSGLREIRGSYEGMHWCLNEAPKLEKHVLESIETDSNIDLERFPDWIRRLAERSVMDPSSLRYLRQLLLFCYKADVTLDNDKIDLSLKTFIEVNRKVGEFSNSLARESPRLLYLARKHCQSVLYRFREKAIKPSHGPGASTTPKNVWSHWYHTIEACYPYADYMYLKELTDPLGSGFNRDHVAQWDQASEQSQIAAKLICVPKDTRGPRLICVHPAESIWIQQGLRVELERVISLRRESPGPWPRNHVQFDDQSVNGRIALLSSRSRRYATIDMKEASDRISESLVQILFGRKYKWFGCCRAQKVRIPAAGFPYADDINCYAPMGNATTFPVQSLVFWAICVASMQSRGFHQPGAAFVFGDDIIVPSECAEAVINDLESFGLLVNRSKTFWRGAFRESCGVDAFKGVDVTPIRWKTTLDAEQLVSLQSLSDLGMRLRISGYEEAAATVYTILRDRLREFYHGRRLFLTNNRHHGGLAEYTPFTSYALRDSYWSSSLHAYVTPVWRIETSSLQSDSHDWNHVLESVLMLERTGRSSIPDRNVSRRSRLVRGWIPVNMVDAINTDTSLAFVALDAMYNQSRPNDRPSWFGC
jgi:hypothetical protein